MVMDYMELIVALMDNYGMDQPVLMELNLYVQSIQIPTQPIAKNVSSI